MKIIADIANDIQASVEDAETYLGRAMDTYEDHPTLSDVYFKIYKDHRSEVTMLHNQVVKFIKEQDKSKFDPKVLETMEMVWSFEHDRIMSRMDYLDVKEKRFVEMKKS